MTTIRGWHFVGKTLRDGRPIPPDGEWLVHRGRVRICKSGLHGSKRPWHALQYAPGPVLCYVECDGIVDTQDDKFACRRRRIIMRADITETLRYYARMQALSVIDLWSADPPDVVLYYLMTGDESIRDAAWDAAWAAARDAAGDAAEAAAEAAAWAAARAARAAAEAAAWAAARAARAAAEAAAWAAGDAAWAAGDAARAAGDAAWDADGREFDALIYEQFGVTA